MQSVAGKVSCNMSCAALVIIIIIVSIIIIRITLQFVGVCVITGWRYDSQLNVSVSQEIHYDRAV